jgi:thioredoxin 1
MATVELTKDNFNEVVGGNSTVIIDFWAEWCGPCKRFAPTFEAISNEHEDIVFAKVNTEQQQELAGYFQIRSIPTLMVFRDQIGIFQQPGAMPEHAFTDLIKQILEVDMDEVRQKLAAQEQTGEVGEVGEVGEA